VLARLVTRMYCTVSTESAEKEVDEIYPVSLAIKERNKLGYVQMEVGSKDESVVP
jgi:hypothetical protein